MNSWLAGNQAKKFTKENLFFPTKIQKILKKQHPRIDRVITKRNPNLVFKMDNFGRKLIEIDLNYSPEGEIRTDPKPYEAFARILVQNFFSSGKCSLLDIGCSTGILIDELNSKFKINAYGLEVFEYHRISSNPEIMNKISIRDFRFPINGIKAAEIVVCTEVGEHIDPIALDTFLDNLRDLCKKYLVISWSNIYPDSAAPPQHISVLSKKDLEKLLSAWGFKKNINLTNSMLSASKKEKYFHNHWRQSLAVWEKING